MSSDDTLVDFRGGEGGGGSGCWGCVVLGWAMLLTMFVLLISVSLLFWNEARAVRMDRVDRAWVREGGSNVVALSNPAQINPANEGKLVHLTAMAETSGELSDPKFLVSSKAIKLTRKIELYQWSEAAKKVQAEKTPGGGKQQATEYTYSKVWSDQSIDSRKFAHPEDHQNRTPSGTTFLNWFTVAKQVSVGEHLLPGDLIDRIGYPASAERIAVTNQDLEKIPEDFRKTMRVNNGYFYVSDSSDLNQPEVGDARVSFSSVKPTMVSILAKQVKNSFEPYQTSNGTEIYRLVTGVESAKSMLEAMTTQNTVLTWVLRFVGFIIMFGGIALCFAPISAIANLVPILRDIVGAGVFIFALGTSLVLTLCTIAVAWVTYRPWVAIPIFAVMVIAAVGLYMMPRKERR
jgi:hypothetical protein